MLNKDKTKIEKNESKRVKKLSWLILIFMIIIIIIIQAFQYLNQEYILSLKDSEISQDELKIVEKVDEEKLNNEIDLTQEHLSTPKSLDKIETITNHFLVETNASNNLEKLNQYRLFLANAAKIINKFDHNENYGAELNIFNQIEHPHKIKYMLYMLIKYNNQLSVQRTTKEEITYFLNNSFLSKLFRITKIPSNNNKNIELKNQILDKMEMFSDYIYSIELQNKFLNK